MNRPSKRDLSYLQNAALNPTGMTFISFASEVYIKARASGWLQPTNQRNVARITDEGRRVLEDQG